MRAHLVVYVKGFCMGAADMVPGVSGGTIALIVGIYERLIRAIAGLDPRILWQLRTISDPAGRSELATTLERMDLLFLLVLGLGIASAVVVVSQVMLAAFTHYPAVLNGFFFGLIAASAVVIARDISMDTPRRWGVATVGFSLAFLVTGGERILAGESLLFVFLAGMIAVSAMILPGISGAAFLYIMGQYEPMLRALRDFLTGTVDLVLNGSTTSFLDAGVVVTTFIVGALLGLLSMARVISWSLAHYRMATLAFLVSLMIGSLRLPLVEIHAVVGTPDLLQFVSVFTAMVVGIVAVLLLDWYSATLDYATPPDERTA